VCSVEVPNEVLLNVGASYLPVWSEPVVCSR